MKISHQWLQDYFVDTLPTPAKLADLFAVHLCEVEEIEEKNRDTIFDLKILPDRAHYLLSHLGVAREVSVLTGIALKPEAGILPKHNIVSEDLTGIKIDIKDTKLCRRYIAQTLTGVKVQASPDWLKQRLESLGQKSINNIVDVGNYVMFAVGQPIHVFDADKVKGEIIVRLAKSEEKITLLTGQEVALRETDLVIADTEGPLAIAGVKGGRRAEVTASTTNLIIEAANFEPTTIRKTSTRLNLRNDSSKRFENEITPALAALGMEKIVKLILELEPQVVLGSKNEIYPMPVRPWEVSVVPDKVTSLVGVTCSAEDITAILTKMGSVVKKDVDSLTIIPPLDRLDIVIPEDIADEVGRVLGYDKLPAKLPAELLVKLLPDKVFFYSEMVKNVLVGRGYSETLLYALVPKGFYQIIYPLASDKSALRDNLLGKLEEALVLNARRADILSLPTIKIFEVSKVFRADGERMMFALGVLPVRKQKGVTAEAILKEDISTIENTLGISLQAKVITGEFGAVCEVDFDELVAGLPIQKDLTDLDFKPLPSDKKYLKFSLYPYIVRDVAVFVPEEVNEEVVHELIKSKATPLCIKSELFDIFTKDFGDGKKKSLAFRLIFQSFERTLEDKEVNEIMEVVYQELKANADWQIR